jgi:hypothetical protein
MDGVKGNLGFTLRKGLKGKPWFHLKDGVKGNLGFTLRKGLKGKPGFHLKDGVKGSNGKPRSPFKRGGF